MPEPTNPASGENPAVNPGATDPNQQPGSGNNAGFDPKTIGDDDFAKVLEDPRLFNLPRIKELRDAQKQLKTQQTEAEKAEAERLKKQGEFETLAQQNEEKAKGWQTKYTDSLTDNAIMAEAIKNGITDVDAAKKLIDRSKIQIDDDGKVQGIAEAVQQLVKDKPYLSTGTSTPSVGSGTNPSNPGNDGKVKLSDMNDPVYYQANRDKIRAALATPGGIIYD